MADTSEKLLKHKTVKRNPWSRISGSPIEEFVITHDEATRDTINALDVFVKECREALCVAPIESDFCGKRYEAQHPFIVKVLLYLGINPLSKSFLVTAYLIDCIVAEPNLTLSECINKTAELFEIDVTAVSRVIDKHFNIYDAELYRKITYLTHTKPMTAKDALYDISMYVSAKMVAAREV